MCVIIADFCLHEQESVINVPIAEKRWCAMHNGDNETTKGSYPNA